MTTMTQESNLPPPTIPQKPREPPHIVFNAPWAHIRGGLNRSEREANLSHLRLAARLITHYAIPPFPICLHVEERLNITSQGRGEEWSSRWKEELLWNLIWPSEGKFVPVCWRFELHTYTVRRFVRASLARQIYSPLCFTQLHSQNYVGCLYST